MSLFDLLFPIRCFECKALGCYVCSSCLKDVAFAKTYCPLCAKASIDGMTHFKCESPQSLSGHISLWKFEKVIRKSILRLKYGFVEDAAEELAIKVAREAKKKLPKFKKVILVPVPLHKSRKNWRGFNQAEILGKCLASEMGWSFEPNLLVRRKAGVSQTTLDKKFRSENVRGAFALNANYKLLSTTYILFDDVWTTGSTLKEAGKVLKRGGAKNVWGLTIAS